MAKSWGSRHERTSTAILVLLALALSFPCAPVSRGEGACAPVDLRPILGPARNQGDKSWCFAQPAADMATLALASQLHGRAVSSEDLALTFHSASGAAVMADPRPELRSYFESHPDFLQALAQQRREDAGTLSWRGIATKKGLIDSGGSPTSALLLANERGVCVSEKYPQTSAEEILKELRRAQALFRKSEPELMACKAYIPAEPALALRDLGAQLIVRAYRDLVDERCAPRIRPERPMIPDELGEASLKSFLRRYGSDAEGRKALQDGLFGVIDALLDKKQVAGISWNADAIMPRDPKDRDPYSGDHSSIIAARKTFGGECRYLIRNSYGDGCGTDIYLKKFARQCEKGHIWVTRKDLETSLYSVFYLK